MMRSFGKKLAMFGPVLLGSVAAVAAAGLDPELNIDGFDPAAESFRINEARRQNAISRQLELNYRMMWAHGFHPGSPPVRHPIGQETIELGPNRWLSRPVYEDDAVPEVIEALPEELPPPGSVGPQLVPPELPGPSDAGALNIDPPNAAVAPPPKPRPAPKKLLPRRPREF